MIVKDSEATIYAAHDIAQKLLLMLNTELNESLTKLEVNDDPAEYIYALVHIGSVLGHKFPHIIADYAQIYGIKKLDVKLAKEWINTAISEYESVVNNENH